MLRKSFSNVCRMGGHRRQQLHGNTMITPTTNNFALSRKPPSSISSSVLPPSSPPYKSNLEPFIHRPAALTYSVVANASDTTPRIRLPTIPTTQKIDSHLNLLVYKQPRQQSNFRIVPSTSHVQYNAFVPYHYDTNKYGMSCRHMSSCNIYSRYHLRAHYTSSFGGANMIKVNLKTPLMTNRITTRQYTNNSKDGGTGRAGESWRAFPNNNKAKFFILSEFMGAFGIGMVLATIVAFPTILNLMKKSDNQYDEVEVEDAIYHQMLVVSKDLEKELRNFLNITPSSGNGDKRTAIGNTTDIVVKVLNSEALQNAIASLVSRVISSEQFKSACQKLIKTLWDDLIHDPETTAQIVQLLNTSIQNENIKRSFKELIMGLLKDDEIYNELTGMVVRLGEENEVLDATRDLLTESAHKALNDPEILDHSMEFATDVVGDDVVQRTSGEALRNTVTYAMSPSLSTFLSIFGIGLVLFSVSAVGNARLSAREGREIDAAASVVVRNAGTIILNTVTKILAIPQRVVSRSCSAVLGFLFKCVSNATTLVTTTTMTILHDAVVGTLKIISYPIEFLLHRFVAGREASSSVLRRMGYILNGTTCFIFRTSKGLCKTIVGSIVYGLNVVLSNLKIVELKGVCLEAIFRLRTFFIRGFG